MEYRPVVGCRVCELGTSGIWGCPIHSPYGEGINMYVWRNIPIGALDKEQLLYALQQAIDRIRDLESQPVDYKKMAQGRLKLKWKDI